MARKDADHPVFRGCIDWHSSVHGVWALLAYTRLTGDRRYVSLVRETLNPEGLRRELADLERQPEFEMPYGRAWFLRLAVEYRRAFDDGLLDPLAALAARSLRERYTKKPPEPFGRTYENDSWALLNLLHFAAARDDAELRQWATEVSRVMVRGAPACDPQIESTGFIAICSNLAWLAAEVLPKDEFAAWLKPRRASLLGLAPVLTPKSDHQNGMNFSRAWGLWALYAATGEPEFAAAYALHLKTSYERPAHWNGSYEKVAHWVAQFGMLAASPLFGARP